MTDARPRTLHPTGIRGEKSTVCTTLARVSRHHRDDEEFDDSNDRRAGVAFCILWYVTGAEFFLTRDVLARCDF